MLIMLICVVFNFFIYFESFFFLSFLLIFCSILCIIFVLIAQGFVKWVNFNIDSDLSFSISRVTESLNKKGKKWNFRRRQSISFLVKRDDPRFLTPPGCRVIVNLRAINSIEISPLKKSCIKKPKTHFFSMFNFFFFFFINIVQIIPSFYYLMYKINSNLNF